MKKLLSFILSIVMVLTMLSVVGFATTEENKNDVTNTDDYTEFFEYAPLDEENALLISFKECHYSDEIIIPSEIDGYKVWGLYDYLFENSDVKSVFIPATVKSINLHTFENASKLEKIICEEGGKYRSVNGVLYNTDYNTLLKVPEAKTEINKYPKKLRTIYENAFRNSSVKEVVLPETVTEICENAFAYSNIEKIVFSEDVVQISEFAFYGSKELKEVVLSDSIEEIASNAFGGCSSLTNIYLPHGLQSIEKAAFHCTGLESVVIPDSVNSISDYAFGYYSTDDIEYVKNEAFKIYGRSETTAEEYATENGLDFTDVSPEQPEITNIYTDKVSVTLFWDGVDDAQGYEIYRTFDDKPFVKIAEAELNEETVYCDLDVDNGQTYTYAVVAVKDNIRSSYNKTAEIKFVVLDTPKLRSAEMTKKGINVKWNTISDAEGYILYRRTEESGWKEIADFKGAVKSFEDTTVKSGKTYFYTVKAYNGTVESGCDYDGVSAMFLSVPELKSACNMATGIKITWKKIAGANGYIIGRKTSSTGWTKIAETEDVSSYLDKTAKAGTTYIYTVVPVCDDIKGFYDEEGITYKRISKVTTESATNTADGVKVVWKPVSKCSGFLVYRKTEDGKWSRIAKVTGSTKSSYTDTKAKSGTKYFYKVVAYSDSCVSYYTEVSRYYLEKPELLSAKSGKSGITAKWEAVNGAGGYYVYRKTGDGSFSRIATVKDGEKNSYLDKSAKKGKTYTYKVKAYKSKTTSAYSNIKTVTDKY